MSPNNNRPPLVGVTPPMMGDGAGNCHLRSPLAASVAVIQPPQCLGSSCRPNPSVAPLHGRPGGALTSAAAGTDCTVVHQSTSPVKMRLSAGSNAAPFHSAPPCEPGQNRVPCAVMGDSTFDTVVTGFLYTTRPSFRSIRYKCPSFGASASIRWPTLLRNKTGALLTSQS